MRVLFLALTACAAEAELEPLRPPQPPERQRTAPTLFAHGEHFELPCWTSLPHLPTRRVGDLRCRIDAAQEVARVRAVRLACDPLSTDLAVIARPMREGWYIVEAGLGTWHLGFGKDRSIPTLPWFGWQQETPFAHHVLVELRKDGPDYPERPAARRWDGWASDDYAMSHVTRANAGSWCTSTTPEGVGGYTTRHEVCFANGAITGASVTVYDARRLDPRCEQHADPICQEHDGRANRDVASTFAGWTLQTRCGDAPAVYGD